MGFVRIEGITNGEPDNETSWVRLPDRVDAIGSPWSLVEGRFDKTAEFAQDAFKYTKDYIDRLAALMEELEDYDSGDIDVDMPEIAPIGATARPSMSDLNLDTSWPANTSIKPVLEDLPDIPDVQFPDLSVTPPVYTTYEPPTIGAVEEPTKPAISTMAVPSAPDYKLPSIPNLGTIVLPNPPSISIPVFDADLTEILEELPVPKDFNWSSSVYNSEIWDNLLVKVVDGIVNGGTGLSPEVEQAIFDRAKYRQIMSNDKAYREVEKYFSSRGYRLPPGAMAAQLAQITAEILLADTDLNNSIMIEQAKLAQDNTHFMLELGRQSEIILRDFHNAQENRLLEAAKVAVSASIDILNAYISRQNIHLEVYKTKAAVYRDRLQAILAEVDIYKAQLEGARITADIQKVQIDIYSAQVAAVEILVRMYNAQLEGVKIFSTLESLKINIFKAETDAYVAQLSAEKNKVDIYTAQIDSERVKAQTYGEQIRAHIALIEAEKTKLETRLAKVNAAAQKNAAELERYKTELRTYEVQIDTKAKEIGATTDMYRAEVTAYAAETEAVNSYYSVKLKEIDAAIAAANFKLQKEVATMSTKTQAYVSLKELQVKGTEGVMSVGAQLAASALSAVSASASYGYSGSTGLSHNFSYGASISENHSIPHDPVQ